MTGRGADGVLSKLSDDDEGEKTDVCGICAHITAAAAQLTPLRILAGVALLICMKEIYNCTK
jgi:hypothetical protein